MYTFELNIDQAMYLLFVFQVMYNSIYCIGRPLAFPDCECRIYPISRWSDGKIGMFQVAPKLKERMMKSGSLMVSYQPLRGLPNFFRLVIPSSGTTQEDVNFLVSEFERLGCDL